MCSRRMSTTRGGRSWPMPGTATKRAPGMRRAVSCAAGDGHQRIGIAVQHQRGHWQCAPARLRGRCRRRWPASGARCPPAGSARRSPRVMRSAQHLLVLRIGRAGDQANEAQAVRHQRRLGAAGRTPHERGRHVGPRPRQIARAARTHDADQAGACAAGAAGGQALRDHAAHRGADHVGAPDAQRIEHAQRVVRHVLQGVGASAPAGRCAAARSARSGCRCRPRRSPGSGRCRGCRGARPGSRHRPATARSPSGQAMSCMPRPMMSSTTGRPSPPRVFDLDLDAVGLIFMSLPNGLR